MTPAPKPATAIEAPEVAPPAVRTARHDALPFFSISDLALRWRCSRGTVYNVLRGQPVLDFAAPGKKGHKVVPLEVVLKIESARTKVWR